MPCPLEGGGKAEAPDSLEYNAAYYDSLYLDGVSRVQTAASAEIDQ